MERLIHHRADEFAEDVGILAMPGHDGHFWPRFTQQYVEPTWVHRITQYYGHTVIIKDQSRFLGACLPFPGLGLGFGLGLA